MDAQPAAGRRAQPEQLARLRNMMASVSVGGAAASGTATPRPMTGERRAVLPVPAALEDVLPDGGLVKGSVVSYSGAGTLLAGLLAAVTADGGHAVVAGVPRLGLLASAEMGAQLHRLAVIADPGPDPVEIAAVLLDGLDLVILGLGGAVVAPARARVIAARARSKGSTLVVTDGRWPAPTLRLDARVAEYTGLGIGRGRVRSVALDIEASGKSALPRRGRIATRSLAGRVEWFSLENTVPSRRQDTDDRPVAS